MLAEEEVGLFLVGAGVGVGLGLGAGTRGLEGRRASLWDFREACLFGQVRECVYDNNDVERDLVISPIDSEWETGNPPLWI